MIKNLKTNVKITFMGYLKVVVSINCIMSIYDLKKVIITCIVENTKELHKFYRIIDFVTRKNYNEMFEKSISHFF